MGSDSAPVVAPAVAPDVAETLLQAMTGTRWFAGKGRVAELRSVTPLPWLDGAAPTGGPGPHVRLEIAEVGYPDDAVVEFYQLALAYYPEPVAALEHAEMFRTELDGLGPVVAYDAMQDVAGCSAVLAALLDERSLVDSEHALRFHVRDRDALTADLEPHIFRGQQSNTSVMYGDVAMIKLFRRLELGRNLDIEVHAALNDAGVADVARLFGWSEATWTSGDQVLGADLAMLVEKLADAEDGWGLALDALGVETTDYTPGSDVAAGTGFVAHAEALGRALAETHHALHAAFGSGTLPGASMAAVMTDRLAAATAVAPALEAYGPGLRAAFDALAGTELDVQRVHGDFHLGQTLHTPTGWKIIDFEGEPAKSLAERSAPDAVWRDVAGMLRSLDYAAASVPGPVGPGWAAACRAAFLAGYADQRDPGRTGGLSETDTALLRAYEAEKAVYEVVYEVRNRPDWVGIPLGALATIAAGPDEGSAHPLNQNPTDAGQHDGDVPPQMKE